MGKEETWNENYQALKTYVEDHKQFPDKKKVENRALLNWWKYNKKRMKQGVMPDDKQALLLELSNMRTVHK
jgi:hypothetical protein